MPTTSNQTDPGARIPGPIHVRDGIPGAPEDDGVSRRTALKMMSATALLTMGAGCTRKPERRILSMVDRAEYQLPGKALPYATTWTDGPWPYGLMVRVVDGRPVKIEGLPAHPLNQGRSSLAMQASLLSLYDPERLRTPRRAGEETTWKDADKAIVAALRGARSAVLVTRSTLGPSERALAERFLASVPAAKHFVYESVHDGPQRRTWKAYYGADGIVMPRLENADVIVSLDADFLGTDGDVLTNARAFAARRRVEGKDASGLSRLYVLESGMTVTGTNADHRIAVRPSAMLDVADAIRASLGGSDGPITGTAAKHGLDAKVLLALASDLRANPGRAVVLAGAHLPAAVHASVAMLNQRAEGTTLAWHPAPPTLPVDDPAEIAAALAAGPDVALFLGVNPAYGDAAIAAAIGKAKLSVGHGLTADETVSACSIELPSAHNMESWNDAAPLPGVHSICQPLIAPLFGGRQEAESLLAWAKKLRPTDGAIANAKDFHDFVRTRWQAAGGPVAGGGQAGWEDALRKGVVGTPSATPFPAASPKATLAMYGAGMGPAGGGNVDVVLAPSANLRDGRDAGIAWLLELPEPTSKLTWDNAAVMSPATAAVLGVEEGDWVKVEAGSGSVRLPVLLQSGIAKNTIVAHLGWGRAKGAGLGNGVGVNVSPLLGAGATPRLALGAKAARADGDHYDLVRTQQTFDQMGREHVRHGTAKEYAKANDFAQHRVHVPPLKQIDDEWDYTKGHKWALAIDLNSCTGCQACVIACQSENNVSVVGKEEVAKSRDMGWIRLDRYEAVDPHDPDKVDVSHQPMLCQHCDNAPCETVCPVNATTHSPEGLNEQVYNRCVGTRYCLNNCPYKVRRFNFFSYSEKHLDHPVQELAANPHVTVRSRGVMEKCTFCIQRINEVKFKATNAGIQLEDGAITPACQQSCPSGAIVFGDANLKGSRVAQARESELAYHVLEEMNVRPNVTYLARVKNLHPSLDEGSLKQHGGQHAGAHGGH